MKIRLLVDIPVHSSHGMKKNKVFEVLVDEVDCDEAEVKGYWVMGLNKQKVKVLPRECAVIHD